MKHTRVKIVKTSKGVQYFLGDGLWFGRVSKALALAGITSGKYTIWEVK